MNKLLTKVILIFFVVCTYAGTCAQSSDSWKVSLNNKIILQQKSNENDLAARLKASLHKNSNKVSITYSTTDTDTSWNRSFFINDKKDMNILTLSMNKQSGSVSLTSPKLKNIIAKKESLYIYTLSLPKDPALAARVRVARVLLGKIEWN